MVELNDLLGYKNRKIYQDSNYFNFTLDSILLAEFCTIKLTTKKILDIGSGTGAIPLILSLKTKASIDAVECQQEQCKLLKMSIHYNNLDQQINLLNEDIKSGLTCKKNNYYDLIVCNPPYFKDSIKNLTKEKAIARHDSNLNLDDIAGISKKILKNNGLLSIVYDSKRLIEALLILNSYNLIPKKIRFVHSKLNTESSRVLIECSKNGKVGLKVEPPFILYNSDHEITDEYSKLMENKE